MQAKVELVFVVDYDEQSCGVPWTKESILSESAIVLRELFGDDIKYETISVRSNG